MNRIVRPSPLAGVAAAIPFGTAASLALSAAADGAPGRRSNTSRSSAPSRGDCTSSRSAWRNTKGLSHRLWGNRSSWYSVSQRTDTTTGRPSTFLASTPINPSMTVW